MALTVGEIFGDFGWKHEVSDSCGKRRKVTEMWKYRLSIVNMAVNRRVGPG